MLVSQIDALLPETQRVLRVAAVVGRRVDSVLLAEVAAATGSEPDEITSGLREALSRHLLVTPRPTRRGYAFRHALLQEAVYDDMLPDERSRVHAAVAHILSREAPTRAAADLAELAHHSFAAHDQQSALSAAVDAARAASEASPVRAVDAVHRALMLWDQVPDAEAVTGMQRSDVLIATANAACLVELTVSRRQASAGRDLTARQSHATRAGRRADASACLVRLLRCWHAARGRRSRHRGCSIATR